jgi:hypothetical protein
MEETSSRKVPNWTFGFTATACRSIFATVFAQVWDSNNIRSIVVGLLNAPMGDQLI